MTNAATVTRPSMRRSQSAGSSLHRSQSASSLTSTRAFNGAPDLDTALAAQGWRKAIQSENETVDKLQRALVRKEVQARKALALQRHHVSMPMPPTTMALMMSRLNRPETREVAMRRSMTRTNTMPSELFINTTPWAQQLAITPYAPLMKQPTRLATRPDAKWVYQQHKVAPGSFPAPWR